MRIFYYTGTMDHLKEEGSGGVSFVISKIASSLVGLGFNISIVSAYKGDSQTPFYCDERIKFKYLQTKIRHSSSFGGFRRIYFWIYIASNLFKSIRDDKPDIAISTSPAISVLLLFFSFFLKIKIIIWENIEINVYHWLINNIRILLFKRASYVIVVSKIDELILSKNGVHVRLIPNPNNANYNITNERSIQKNIKLLAAGRLVYQKGFDYLIEICFILKNIYNVNYSLTIVGNGPDELKLKTLVEGCKLAENITFVPFTKNISEIYLINDLFLLSSRYEGLPIVLLDSQASGLPTVAFDCPTGPSEVIENGVNGYLVNCFDVEQFASKVKLLADDRELLALQSKNAIKLSRKYSVDNLIHEWEEVFRSI